jgi:hypothetical protein
MNSSNASSLASGPHSTFVDVTSPTVSSITVLRPTSAFSSSSFTLASLAVACESGPDVELDNLDASDKFDPSLLSYPSLP